MQTLIVFLILILCGIYLVVKVRNRFKGTGTVCNSCSSSCETCPFLTKDNSND